MTFMHVFTTMQCAAMARVVFVKSVKKVKDTEEFLLVSKKFHQTKDGKEMGGQQQEGGDFETSK